MSSRTLIWVIVAVVAAVVIVSNVRMQFKSAQNNEKQQHIEAAFITVTAPALERKSLNEKNIKESLKDSVSYVCAYGIFSKKTEYSVIFTKYNNDFEISGFANSLISLFAENNFKHEMSDEKIDDNETLKISGTFERSGKKFGLEALYIKREFYAWQILTVFPLSGETLAEAKRFISSVQTDAAIKIKETPAEKTK